jgi:hypothetical protein
MTARGSRALVAIGGVLALLVVVGASARDPVSGGGAAPALPRWPLFVVLGAGAVLAAALLWAWRPDVRLFGPAGPGGRRMRPGPLTTATAILVPVLVISIYSAVGSTGRHSTPAPIPNFSTHGHRQPTADEPGKKEGERAAAFASGIAIGILGLAAFLVVRRRRRENAPAPRDLVAQGARDAIDAIAIPKDPRAAVLAAYARMEAALARAGLARRGSEAPREYLARLDAALGGGREPATRLTGLFERARFSTHPIGEDVRSDALGALDALRAELEAPA